MGTIADLKALIKTFILYVYWLIIRIVTYSTKTKASKGRECFHVQEGCSYIYVYVAAYAIFLSIWK